MSIASGIAIYFVVWWICLFAVLPFGIRNAHEAGEAVEQGNDEGAPVKTLLPQKLLATTALAMLVFALIWGQMNYGWIGFGDIPFLRDMPTH